MKFETFKNLDVWQQANQVSTVVVELCATEQPKATSEIMQQIKKLAIGLFSAVNEACMQDDSVDALRFLNVANTKLVQLEVEIERAEEFGNLPYFKVRRTVKHIKKMRILLLTYISYHESMSKVNEPSIRYAG